VRFDDTILSKEIGAGTDESWDFFSEDTVNSNIVLVRLTGEDDLIATVNSPIIILVLDETKVLPRARLG